MKTRCVFLHLKKGSHFWQMCMVLTCRWEQVNVYRVIFIYTTQILDWPIWFCLYVAIIWPIKMAISYVSAGHKEIVCELHFPLYWLCYFMFFWQVTTEPLIVLPLINIYNVVFTNNRSQCVLHQKFLCFSNSFQMYSLYYCVCTSNWYRWGAYIIFIPGSSRVCVCMSLVRSVKSFPKCFSSQHLHAKLSVAASNQNTDGLGYDLCIRLWGKLYDYDSTHFNLALVGVIKQDFFWSVWSSLWMPLAVSPSFPRDWSKQFKHTRALYLWEYFSPSLLPSAWFHMCSGHTHTPHTHIHAQLSVS